MSDFELHGEEPQNGRRAEMWKWVIGILVSLMLVVTSGTVATAIALSHAPSQIEVNVIRERQQEVLQRLAAIDAQVIDNNEDIAAIVMAIERLEELVRQHIEGSVPRG